MSKLLFISGLFFSSLFITLPKNFETISAFDYAKAWKEVQVFDDKQLPGSALKLLDEIYAAAKAEKNTGQLIKAVIHQLKFVDYKEENAFIKNLNLLKSEADQATFPAKPILHSMLAEMYWQYYQSNRYTFLNRSETTDFDESDIETWSLAKIVKETFAQYELSLADAEKSKKEDISNFEEIYDRENKLGLKYRSSLYDFLAHRAIGFFSGEEPGLIKPAYAFTLNKAEYLSDAKRFSELKLETKDEFSMKFYALRIYQNLTLFHLKDKDPSALVELDLQRLQFVKNHLTLSSKNELYRKALETLEERVINHPISTKVTLEIAKTYQETAAKYDPLRSEDHKWDLKRAIALCNAAIERFPESDGAKACFNFKEPLKYKNIEVTIEEQNVPGLPFRALVEYQNLEKLHYRIIRTDRQSVRELRARLRKTYKIEREEEFIKHFAAKTPAQTGNFELADDGDYQMHSVEVKLEALSVGEYMVLFSHDEDFNPSKNGMAYAFTVITNISYIHRNTSEGETEFYVLDRTSGHPLKGVILQTFSNNYDYKKREYETELIGNFTSDREGYAKVGYINKNDRRNFYVDFRLENDFNSTESIDSYRSDAGTIYQYKQEDYDQDVTTFFFLDRAIYRPGQTIYFKGLVIDPDKKNPTIKTNYSTTIELRDVNYQPQGSIEVKTNEFGTFSGSFTAPTGGLTGQMQLVNTRDNGRTFFQVEEYKRPKFYVGFNPVEGAFQLNDEIEVKGYATAYSGVQIDGANVTYRVVRQARFPFWWWCRWGYYPSSPEMEITSGITQSDENGQFTITFNALPDLSVDPSSDPTFSYTIYADVTDINGETHSSSTAMAAGYKSLRVGVDIDTIDKDALSPDKQFAIQTTNLSGQFLAAKGSIQIFRLDMPDRAFRKRLWQQPDRTIYSQEQYYQYFPHDQYADESNQYQWNRGKEVFSTQFDTEKEKDFKIKNLKSWKSGLYVLEIRSQDKHGKEVKELSYFEVMSPSERKISIPAIHSFHAEKLTAEPGETAVILYGYLSSRRKNTLRT